MSLKELESITGVLTWISYAMVSGKSRRNELYRAISRMNNIWNHLMESEDLPGSRRGLKCVVFTSLMT